METFEDIGGEWCVEVVRNYEHALVNPQAPAFRCGFRRNQPGDGLTSANDEDLLAGGDAAKQFGEVRLRLVNADGCHVPNID